MLTEGGSGGGFGERYACDDSRYAVFSFADGSGSTHHSPSRVPAPQLPIHTVDSCDSDMFVAFPSHPSSCF